MKQSPQMQKLEEVLRHSKLSAHGFLGSDKRSLSEIIDTDIAQVGRFDVSVSQIAEKMQQITDTAIKGLGTWVKIDDKRNHSSIDLEIKINKSNELHPKNLIRLTQITTIPRGGRDT